MAIEVILDGDNSSAIQELHDLEIYASVEKGTANASIVTDQITFVNEYAVAIRNHVLGGANGTTDGIYEGLDLQINESGQTIFDGYLDFLNDFEIVNPTTVKCGLKKHNSSNDFASRAKGLSFGYLDEINFINSSHYINVPYVNEKEFNFIEFAFLSFTIYSIVRDLEGIIKQIADQLAFITGDATGGVTGPAAAAILTAALIAIDLAFALLMIALLVDLVAELFAYLLSPIKFHKAIRVSTLLERGCTFLGHQYNTSIQEMPELVILPSKTGISQDEQQGKLIQSIQIIQPGVGYPSTADFGYFFLELLTLVNITFQAEFTIKNGVVEQHAENSAWWIQISNYVLPPVLNESIITNAKELVSDKIVGFKHDLKDVNTLENFKGTLYEIKTLPINFTKWSNVLMEGTNFRRGKEKDEKPKQGEIPYALGNRKNELNSFEKLVRDLLEECDKFINFFINTVGLPIQQSDLASQVNARIGMLKLETDSVHIPKLMRMNGENKLPANHRDIWSAKYLYENYYNEKSFVLNNFGNQYYVYKDIPITPFGRNEFNQLAENPYFSDSDGEFCKLVDLRWNVSQDTAILSYIIKKIFSINMEERYIEKE